jgi:hypothetical protein
MSANMSANESIWSPVNGNEQSYGSLGSNSIETGLEMHIEYAAPPESEDDPLIHVPDNEHDINGEVLASV